LISGAVLIFIPVTGSFMEPRILGGRFGVTMGTLIEDQFTQAFNWPLGASLSFTLQAVQARRQKDAVVPERVVQLQREMEWQFVKWRSVE
ncbi:hypothetical protein ACC709_36445, partial [Rhizobium ruizarguesonis]